MSILADATDLWDVPAQGRATSVLRAAVARESAGSTGQRGGDAGTGGVGHAWALVGPAGVGQELVGRALAAALNCPSPTAAGQPCGGCSICRRCARGAYPAHREFSPSGVLHRVDDVRRGWLQAASLTPTEGSWKVLHVHDADRMTEAAANAFLKGLEEPPERTVWLLDVSDPDELPETILSRCRALRVVGWSTAALEAEAARLGLADAAERRLAARAALGSPVALRRLAAPGGLDDFRRHRRILTDLREEGQGQALLVARQLADEVKEQTDRRKEEGKRELEELAAQYGDEIPRGVRRQVEERQARHEREARLQVHQAALDDLLGWLRDCLLVGCGGDPALAISADAAEELRADADAYGPALLLAAVEEVMATREALELNVQAALALEALFLHLSALRTLSALSPGVEGSKR